ncbi:hypothetical protein DCAR_0312390 [Daucus carota subsp. sativus]|uniref:Uncharacterized protein n=1 Tax=Daucus carota subsp. sativus TaxID=79200 RepID=A0AAF0WNZ2_DAUCS|nr:hypothetical protein DCAR_0312390 [Daucus carota subsp. sativus]
MFVDNNPIPNPLCIFANIKTCFSSILGIKIVSSFSIFETLTRIRNSYFLPGAEVKIECRFQATSPRTREQITFCVNRTTNKNGIYKLEVAGINGIECVRENPIENLYRTRLIRSSNHECNVPGYRSTTDEITIKSQAANLCIYSLNVINFRPFKTEIALCGN